MFIRQELSDFERDTLLIPAWFWLRNVPSKQAGRIIDASREAFEAYKASVTDARGYVQIETGLNMFSTKKKTRRVQAESLSASQCAGAYVSNEIDLAFKLWLGNFPPFKTVLEKFGLFKTLAVIGVFAGKPPPIWRRQKMWPIISPPPLKPATSAT